MGGFIVAMLDSSELIKLSSKSSVLFCYSLHSFLTFPLLLKDITQLFLNLICIFRVFFYW